MFFEILGNFRENRPNFENRSFEILKISKFSGKNRKIFFREKKNRYEKIFF